MLTYRENVPLLGILRENVALASTDFSIVSLLVSCFTYGSGLFIRFDCRNSASSKDKFPGQSTLIRSKIQKAVICEMTVTNARLLGGLSRVAENKLQPFLTSSLVFWSVKQTPVSLAAKDTLSHFRRCQS